MAWTRMAVGSAGTASQFAAVSVTIDTATGGAADVLWAFASGYGSVPLIADFVDAQGNTWTLTGASDGTAGGDAALLGVSFRCVGPTTTHASHQFTLTPSVGGRMTFPSLIVMAFRQGAASAYGTSVANANSSTTLQPGSIGNANDLLCTGVAYYTNPGYVIDSSFASPTDVAYTSNHIGAAASWKETSAGTENPTWTASGSNVQVGRTDSFTGTGGGGGGGGKPMAYYQMLRGM